MIWLEPPTDARPCVGGNKVTDNWDMPMTVYKLKNRGTVSQGTPFTKDGGQAAVEEHA